MTQDDYASIAGVLARYELRAVPSGPPEGLPAHISVFCLDCNGSISRSMHVGVGQMLAVISAHSNEYHPGRQG